MTEQYSLLYDNLILELKLCMENELPEIDNVGTAFWIANNYWDKLKLRVAKDGFANDKEEIEFFKVVKPEFTAQIEFFTLLSEALICVPDATGMAMMYWEEEAKRFRRFCDRNEKFVNYFESGKVHNDSLFFLRTNADPNKLPKSIVYDSEPEFCSSHDHLVRSYLAQKMYWEYCKEKMKELKPLMIKP